MADKLQRLFEYWVLRSLPPGDDFEQVQQRLERLQRQLHPGVPTLDERDPYTLMTEPLRLHLSLPVASASSARVSAAPSLASTSPKVIGTSSRR